MDNGVRSLVLGLPVSKTPDCLVVDASLAVFSVWIAFYLRLGYFLPVFEVPMDCRYCQRPLLWWF